MKNQAKFSSTNEQSQDVSELTLLVRSAWQSTLDHDKFDDDTSFFDAGGDSFVLLALIAELTKSSGLTIKAVHILRAPTIQGQAAILSDLMSENCK